MPDLRFVLPVVQRHRLAKLLIATCHIRFPFQFPEHHPCSGLARATGNVRIQPKPGDGSLSSSGRRAERKAMSRKQCDRLLAAAAGGFNDPREPTLCRDCSSARIALANARPAT